MTDAKIQRIVRSTSRGWKEGGPRFAFVGVGDSDELHQVIQREIDAYATCANVYHLASLQELTDNRSEEGGLFDLVYWDLLLSPDECTRSLSRALRRLLSPEGLLLVNTVTVHDETASWLWTAVGDDACWAPSRSLMAELFPGFARRYEGKGIGTGRSLWSFTPKDPVVTLIAGRSRAGKTEKLRAEIGSDGCAVRVDQAMASLEATGVNCRGFQAKHRRLGRVIDEYFQMQDESGLDRSLLGSQLAFARFLEERRALDAFAMFILEPISGDFDRYMIEGGILTNKALQSRVCKYLTKRGMRVWITSPC